MNIRLTGTSLLVLAGCTSCLGCAPFWNRQPQQNKQLPLHNTIQEQPQESGGISDWIPFSGKEKKEDFGFPQEQKSFFQKKKSDQPELQGQLAIARLNERHGQYSSARRLYEKIAVENSELAMPHHRLGVISAKEGKFEEAEKHFTNAARIGPVTAELMADTGYNLYLQNKLEEAEAVLQQAVDQEPNHESAVNNLALVKGAQGDGRSALTLFMRVGSEAEAHANLAYVFAQQGDLEQATKAYDRALSYDNSLKPAAHALLQVAHRQSQINARRQQQEQIAEQAKQQNEQAPQQTQEQPQSVQSAAASQLVEEVAELPSRPRQPEEPRAVVPQEQNSYSNDTAAAVSHPARQELAVPANGIPNRQPAPPEKILTEEDRRALANGWRSVSSQETASNESDSEVPAEAKTTLGLGGMIDINSSEADSRMQPAPQTTLQTQPAERLSGKRVLADGGRPLGNNGAPFESLQQVPAEQMQGHYANRDEQSQETQYPVARAAVGSEQLPPVMTPEQYYARQAAAQSLPQQAQRTSQPPAQSEQKRSLLGNLFRSRQQQLEQHQAQQRAAAEAQPSAQTVPNTGAPYSTAPVSYQSPQFVNPFSHIQNTGAENPHAQHGATHTAQAGQANMR